jgi:2-C-methyl-D-erythritol 4-phosphate cytidylyltransferase/2-C-methyl-D-erythritol 2,4-cyclodiphosphate synthase
LIPAAGIGARLGSDVPKQYQKINGKAVLRHTIDKFLNIEGLESVKVVINPDHKDFYDEAVEGLNLDEPMFGSNSRKISVYNGLKGFLNPLPEEIILIHDAARPLVCKEDILKLLKTMADHRAATLAIPVSDTLVRYDEPVNREDLWALQTPQAFHLQSLIETHEKFANDDSFTDDSGLMRAAGHHIEIVPASRENIKITSIEDMKMAEKLMNSQMETRTAFGFDVHAFEKTPSERKLMLGGVDIPNNSALVGHSDADVVLHAITDAILGSINDGDIGTHFPPSDPQWKEADSALFLKASMKKLNDKNGLFKFVDVTILCEEPKIGPHRDCIQKRISEILDVSRKRISIKATTTEGLGFTGRKEGIACQAAVTVLLPQEK